MNGDFAVNQILDARTAADIDRPIERIISDLGNPSPPLDLDMVRELLNLDRQFYSSADDSVLRETVHRLKVGAKQVVRRPSLLLDVVKKRDLKALWVPDRRRILIDQDMPSAKHRWGEGHEIGHSIIPWHEPLAHGDQRRTLSLTCEIQLESEANYAAGRLLFLQDLFAEHVNSGPVDLARVRKLAGDFQNTITSTLWRTVETLDVPAFALISQHPRADMVDATKPLVRYFVRSPAFIERMPRMSPVPLYKGLRGFCWGRKGPIGEGEMVLNDGNGDAVGFQVECFYNGWEALTFAVAAP